MVQRICIHQEVVQMSKKMSFLFDHMRFRLPATLKCCIHTKKKKQKKKKKKHKTQKTKNKTKHNKTKRIII